MTDVDMVNHPPHYNAYSIEVIEVSRHCSFDIGNAIKYMLRHLHKGASYQDLDKAAWYLNDHAKTFSKWDQLIPNPEAQQKLAKLIYEYVEQPGAMNEVYEALRMILIGDAARAHVYLLTALANHPVD